MDCSAGMLEIEDPPGPRGSAEISPSHVPLWRFAAEICCDLLRAASGAHMKCQILRRRAMLLMGGACELGLG